MSETVVAEGVVRVDKSLIMELWICCGKGVGITLCVHSFSMAYPQRNGTYPRCPRPFEGKRWSTVSGTLQRVIKAIKQLLQKGWPGNRVYWKDIFFSFYTSGHLSPSIPTNTLRYQCIASVCRLLHFMLDLLIPAVEAALSRIFSLALAADRRLTPQMQD